MLILNVVVAPGSIVPAEGTGQMGGLPDAVRESDHHINVLTDRLVWPRLFEAETGRNSPVVFQFDAPSHRYAQPAGQVWTPC